MKLGVTGHQTLDEEQGWVVIRSELHDKLTSASKPLVGLSSLAPGADQVFAQEILRIGAELIAVLPFASYREKVPADGRHRFDTLLARSRDVVALEGGSTDEESYMKAGCYIVDHCDRLLAVWDGHPAAGFGGTADVVQYAQWRQRSIWFIDASPWRAIRAPKD